MVLFRDRPLILTAQNIVNVIKIKGLVVVKGEDDKPLVIPIKKGVANIQLSWKSHVDADLAAFEIFPQDQQTQNILKKRFLPIEFFSNKKASQQTGCFGST